MKILFIDYLSYSAHQNFNLIHIEALTKMGCSLHLLGKKGQFDNVTSNTKISIGIIPEILFKYSGCSPLIYRIVYICRLLYCRFKYNSSKYDLIIIPTYDPMSIWVYRTSQKVIMITHDVHYLDNKIKYLAVKSMPSHYVHIGLSTDMAERLKELYPNKQVGYVPHGLCPASTIVSKPDILKGIKKYLICPINNMYNAQYVDDLFHRNELYEYLENNDITLLVKNKLLLRPKGSERIVTINNSLSKPEYDYLLQNAMAVVLPYDYDYKYRCSGILFECVVRNTPVLAINIDAMSIYKDKINICLFDDVFDLIEGIDYFRTHLCVNYDLSIFQPYKYWVTIMNEL